MGSTSFANGVLILIVAAASMLTVTMANRGWYYGFNNTHHNWGWGRKTNHTANNNGRPNKIIVGGSDHWHFGFNYSVWAFQNAPFYVNDVLVFKYDPPSDTTPPRAHSVYLLPDLWSYLNCDLTRAKMIANTTHGVGDGFKFVLKKWQPYYFACGEHDGIHCNLGGMKFSVMPLLRRWY